MRTALVALAALATGSVAPPRDTPPPQLRTVSIKGFAYLPDSLAASPGDTIAFTNQDLVIHTVTADTARWDSGDLKPRATFRLVVPSRGHISFHCELHPAMKGQVHVR